MRNVVTPDWVKDAVFYQIFPDRFAKSEHVFEPANLEAWDAPPTTFGFKGGDLLGVVEHLDYLQDLGINALYFNPVFQSAANHRYHTHDYYQVDPILGGNAALRTLLDEAHARDIRVVLDGVFNHASRGFFQFNHLLENGPASPYVNWFTIKGWPLNAYDHGAPPNYGAWWGLPALPEFNTDHPPVREFLWDVAEYWIKFGVDGWRLDVPADIDDDAFWQTFRRRVKAANPEAYIVGELWEDSTRWLQGDQFDAVMNYLFSRAALGFFGGANLAPGLRHGPHEVAALDAPAFAQEIERTLSLYDWEIVTAQLNLLGSHDTPRTLSMLNGDKNALKLTTLCQMTLPGAPCIYYGDEIGMMGGNDPHCRGAFPWDEAAWDHDLRGYIREAIALRHAHPALRHGAYKLLIAEGAMCAYMLETPEEHLVVAFNAGPCMVEVAIQSANLAGSINEGQTLSVLFGGGSERRVIDGRLILTLPAQTGRVYAVGPTSG